MVAANFEHSGIYLNMENSWNPVQHQSDNNCNKQNIFVHHSNICVKLLFWTSDGGDLFAGVYME